MIFEAAQLVPQCLILFLQITEFGLFNIFVLFQGMDFGILLLPTAAKEVKKIMKMTCKKYPFVYILTTV